MLSLAMLATLTKITMVATEDKKNNIRSFTYCVKLFALKIW